MNHRRAPLAALSLVSVFAIGCAAPTGGAERVGEEGAALSPNKCPDHVPASLTPAADQQLFFVLQGEGVQIYACNPTASGFAWGLVAPQADLLNPGEQVVGTHYAGPTWESEDGSTVRAARIAAAPAPIPGAIPWLLLGAVAHDGEGKMSQVTSIQRLSTVGGVAPSTGCDAAHAGAIVNVAYTADYYFYKTGNAHGNNAQCGG